jgi:acyl-CoA reductase-like NAD-dependent aldehyde dehydrogenase
LTTEASSLISCSPATGETVGSVAITPVTAIDDIVTTSRSALTSWRALTVAERSAMLAGAGEKLVERAPEIGELLCREMGKPLRAAVREVRGCGRGMAGKIAEIAAAIEPDVVEGAGRRSVIYHDPLGVCAAITPWNYPVSMIHWLVVPALTAGNTVVLKPSEETPLVGQAYADVLNEHLPEGVLQVVHGADEQGKALVLADVDLIAFTGSRAAGKHIMRSAAEGLKRIVLELGGKDPLIVLEGANIEDAAQFAVGNSFDNTGQACISTERIFVHDAVADEFERRLGRLSAEVTVGDPLADPDIGPMISQRQLDHVTGQLRDAVDKGARVVLGSIAPDGLYLQPIVLADVTDTMEIAQEETFGPVACVTRFDDVEAVVASVNSAPYGLGAVVFGTDDEAEQLGRQLNAGMIGINRGVFGAPGTPWVGAKESGYGFHGSPDGHRQFTQTRVLTTTLRS